MKTNRTFFVALVMSATFCLLSGCKKDSEEEPVGNLPVVVTANVNSVLMNTAWSGGTISSDGGTTVTARGVVWSMHDLPTTADSKSMDGSGAGSFLSHVTDLDPGATYYLRAYATNAAGTSYGSTMIFSTVSDTFTDGRDGNLYHSIQIGDQIWMAENLKYLPSVVGPDQSSFTAEYCYVYGYDGTNVASAKATPNYKTYGVLYNWQAVQTAAPSGWHVPTDQEWKTLEMTLGMSQTDADYKGMRGTDQGAALAGNDLLWVSGSLASDPAFSSSGFGALPGGFYRPAESNFVDIGNVAVFWCFDEVDNQVAWRRRIPYNGTGIERSDVNKNIGFLVRCVRDLVLPAAQ